MGGLYRSDQVAEDHGSARSHAERFVKEHPRQLTDLQLPGEAVLDLLNASLHGFIAQKLGEVTWQVPDESLSRYPEPVRLFFRPPSAGTLGAVSLGSRPPDPLIR